MKVYNYAETLAMLNRVADRVGRDTVYHDIKSRDMPEPSTRCYNVHMRRDGTIVPGCIVGQVAVLEVGIDPAELWDPAHSMRGASAPNLVKWISDNKGVGFTDDAVALLACVQKHQDSGCTWGDAISKADGAPAPSSVAEGQ